MSTTARVTANLSRRTWTVLLDSHSFVRLFYSRGCRMRIYAPTETTAVLDGLLDEPSMARGVVHHAVLPPRPAAYGDFPEWLDARIVAGLGTRGIERPYVHQAESMAATRL